MSQGYGSYGKDAGAKGAGKGGGKKGRNPNGFSGTCYIFAGKLDIAPHGAQKEKGEG